MSHTISSTEPHQLAEALRNCAARLENEAALGVLPNDGSDPLPLLTRWQTTLRKWGVQAGALLDEVFARGLIEWKHYEELKADEQRRDRSEQEWHYRLFLATAGRVAASDAETGRVLIPGFLFSQGISPCDPPHEVGCARAYGAALRRLAKMVEERAGRRRGEARLAARPPAAVPRGYGTRASAPPG